MKYDNYYAKCIKNLNTVIETKLTRYMLLSVDALFKRFYPYIPNL